MRMAEIVPPEDDPDDGGENQRHEELEYLPPFHGSFIRVCDRIVTFDQAAILILR